MARRLLPRPHRAAAPTAVNLLLDTHAFLWWIQDDAQLGARTRAAIERASVHVSAATIWEIAIKIPLGKLRWQSTRISLDTSIAACGFAELPITPIHAAKVLTLPRHHGDPFDRILIAQALAEGLTIVTADGAFETYGVAILDAASGKQIEPARRSVRRASPPRGSH